MQVETMQIDSDSRSDDEDSIPYPGDDPAVQTVVQEIKEQIRQIEKAVINKEPRFILRVLRLLPATRRKLTSNIVRVLVASFYNYSASGKETLLDFVDEAFADFDWMNVKIRVTKNSNAPLLPEVDAYLHLLVLVRLIDSKHNSQARTCSETLMSKITSHNRRSLDLIAAKCFFYHSLANENVNCLVSVRRFFHARLRTATLRNDFEGQAVLINCLMRNYLHYNLYDQADKLVSKSVFPESASNNEWARFLYYLGRIKAARLEYSEAHKHLVQALRKAPQHAALGFRQTAQKLLVCVDLLLGDIPDKQIFRQPLLRKSLLPYYYITQTVREGNLRYFGEALNLYSEQFRADRNYALITRLRHNVIKTAIRSIGLSYSRISPKSIAKKLGLDSPEDAEFIIAKAIRDGVIEARLDPHHGYMQSNEVTDIYRTREPQLAFHQRISFCLDLHNQSVKAMRYPPKSYGKDLESAEERREREQQDLELAKEMAEEDDDVFP